MQNMNIRSDEDIEMHGFVSWVGRSSIESTMTLKQNDANGNPRFVSYCLLHIFRLYIYLDQLKHSTIFNVLIQGLSAIKKTQVTSNCL